MDLLLEDGIRSTRLLSMCSRPLWLLRKSVILDDFQAPH